MSQEFFEVLSVSELFGKIAIGENPPEDAEAPQWVSRLREREDLDGWMVVSICCELDYAGTFFWYAVTETFKSIRTGDVKHQESDAEFFERCLSNHLYTLDEMYDGDIMLEPVAFLLERIEEHEGEVFHPPMLLIAYALWSLDKAMYVRAKTSLMRCVSMERRGTGISIFLHMGIRRVYARPTKRKSTSMNSLSC